MNYSTVIKVLTILTLVASGCCSLTGWSNTAISNRSRDAEERHLTKRGLPNFLGTIQTLLQIGKTVTEVIEFFEDLTDKYKATAKIEIENYYKETLYHPKIWTDKGISETYPEEVYDGFKEALEVHGKGDGKGIELLLKFELKVNYYQIDVYIYARVQQKVLWRKENKFGIGIVKTRSDSEGFANADEMEFMEITEFSSESHIITHCYKSLVCVSGTFSAGNHAEGLIRIFPVNVEDFAKGKIHDSSADRQEDLDEELKYGTDRTQIADRLYFEN